MIRIYNMIKKNDVSVFFILTLITFSKADTLYSDERIIVIGESSLQCYKSVIVEHVAAMYKIWEWYKTAVHDSNFTKPYDTLNSKHIVKVYKFSPELLDYTLPVGGMWAHVNDNQIIKFNPYGIIDGKPTIAELLEYEKTKIIPESFKTVSIDSAMYIARKFLDLILQESRVGYKSTIFDSIKIDQIDWKYIIYMKCKMKNDIRDSRSAEIRVCAKTGNVSWYSGDLNLPYNLDYIPTITKEEAITIYKEHMEKNNDTAKIYKICLSKNNRSKWKWGWCIFATPPGKGGFNYYIIIDSENGAILHDFRF